MRFLTNVVVAAIIIALATELGKRFSFIGALLVALPITSILALSFLYTETKDLEKVANVSNGIFWLVLPTLPFFLTLPFLLKRGFNYWASLGLTSIGTVLLFFAYAWTLKKLGVHLG